MLDREAEAGIVLTKSMGHSEAEQAIAVELEAERASCQGRPGGTVHRNTGKEVPRTSLSESSDLDCTVCF